MKLFIIHPGIQHSPRLANAAVRSNLFSSVTLLTSILFKPNIKTIGILKKRIKPIDKEINIINHYFYTFLFEISKLLHNKIIVNRNNQSHNNPIYFWQQIFGYLCLPQIWLNRKDCMVICFETAGWPITKYCKKWGIPVIMDFASISHEKAKELGINETKYGIRIKSKERKYIDYALFCSEFCRESFEGKTSSKKDIILYLGAERVESLKEKGESPQLSDDSLQSEEMGGFDSAQPNNNFDSPVERSGQAAQPDKNKEKVVIKISFIANLEYRKGLDILLDALLFYQEPYYLEIYIIGRISKEWVETHLDSRILPPQITLIYKAAMPQQKLFKYLEKQQFDLNIQPSRFDSFAMVVPETMMLGIPNILSPFVGAGEMLDHLKNGYRMPDLNSTSIIDSLKWYFSLDNNENQLLRENVLLKSKELSWENYYSNTAKVFKEILTTTKKIKIAFIVELPTQFEVPFYQYINNWIQEQRLIIKEDDVEKWEFHVIYSGTNTNDYLDRELKQKVQWGFDLYHNYTYFIADNNRSLSSIDLIIEKQQYDFIIINGYKNSYKGLPQLCKSKGIPIALRIDSVIYNLSPVKKLLKRLYLPFAYRHFDHFFAVGSETKKYLNWLGITTQKVHYFSYATHDEWFMLNALDKNKVVELKTKLGLKNERIILSVAKFIERESPWDILNAFKLLDKTDIALVLVGDGRDRQELEAFAAKNNHLKIIFTGYVPYTSLPYYYGLTDLFIHAAKNEPWGVSVQEAIASGCTVITSDKVGSSTDLIHHGVNGFIYQYNNIIQLKNAIEQGFKIDLILKEKTNLEILQNWGYKGIWEQIKLGALNGINKVHI